MLVVIKGDFEFGIENVIGPFENYDEVRSSEIAFDTLDHEIYQVEPSMMEWGEASTVEITFDRMGRVGEVFGPCRELSPNPWHPRTNGDGLFRVVPVAEFMGEDDFDDFEDFIHFAEDEGEGQGVGGQTPDGPALKVFWPTEEYDPLSNSSLYFDPRTPGAV